jgi:hypothetical protein
MEPSAAVLKSSTSPWAAVSWQEGQQLSADAQHIRELQRSPDATRIEEAIVVTSTPGTREERRRDAVQIATPSAIGAIGRSEPCVLIPKVRATTEKRRVRVRRPHSITRPDPATMDGAKRAMIGTAAQ